MKLTLGSKLISGFLMVAVIGGFVGWLGISSMSRINDMLNYMYDENLVPVTQLSDANLQAVYHNRSLYDFIIETDRSEMDSIARQLETFKERYGQLVSEYGSTNLSDGERTIFNRLSAD